jgi:hypothetical protein
MALIPVDRPVIIEGIFAFQDFCIRGLLLSNQAEHIIVTTMVPVL